MTVGVTGAERDRGDRRLAYHHARDTSRIVDSALNVPVTGTGDLFSAIPQIAEPRRRMLKMLRRSIGQPDVALPM